MQSRPAGYPDREEKSGWHEPTPWFCAPSDGTTKKDGYMQDRYTWQRGDGVWVTSDNDPNGWFGLVVGGIALLIFAGVVVLRGPDMNATLSGYGAEGVIWYEETTGIDLTADEEEDLAKDMLAVCIVHYPDVTTEDDQERVASAASKWGSSNWSYLARTASNHIDEGC